MQETRAVTISMFDKTIAQTEEIHRKLHTLGFSDAINQAIMITNQLLDYIATGHKIIISGKDGKIELNFDRVEK